MSVHQQHSPPAVRGRPEQSSSPAPPPLATCVSQPPETLIIGFGNELRGDDAAGPRIIEALEQWRPKHCRMLARHQLTPELVEVISGARCVIFVDAAIDCPNIEVRTVQQGQAAAAIGHALTPANLLALARSLYGVDVPAWIVRLPASGFELGAGLSPGTERSVDDACRIILSLVRS